MYVLAALWGIGDAIWQTQINALYGVLFASDEEAAFSNYRLWESMGFLLAFITQACGVCVFPKLLLTIVFLITYITSMIICEVFLPADENLLYFVILKYVAGTSHHLFGPVSILLSRRDICSSVSLVYKRGGTTQSKSFEITAEQMQKEQQVVLSCPRMWPVLM